MPIVASESICVRHWDFSETSQTVSLFTRDLGMLRGLAKGAKREHGRFSGGIDLLTRGQMVAIVRSGRELATLTDWDLLESFRHLRERLDANRAGFYMAELCTRMIADEQPHPRSYDALVAALRGLAEPAGVDPALLRFQWALLEDCGYRPSLDAAPGTDALAFSPQAGGVVAAGAAAPAWPVRRETIELLRRVAEEAQGGNPVAAERTGSVGGALGAKEPATVPPEAPAGVEPIGVDPPRSALDAETSRRANRLLAAYLRELLGFEPPTMAGVFGAIQVRG